MNCYYIYLTTNLINGKQYIGQHKGKINDNYLGSGANIKKAINKYGKENFKKEILQICASREEADLAEQYYIKLYNAVENDNFYNLQEGGTGGDGWRACQRWMKNHPEKAQEIYKSNLKQLQQWIKENPEEYSERVIKPMLEASHKRLKDNPELIVEQMKKLNQGKDKWRKEHPEEYQKQIDKWRKAGSEANSQKIKCITTGEIFNSQSEVSRFYGIPQANISKCIRGERKSAGKHPITKEKLTWKLYNQNEEKQ